MLFLFLSFYCKYLITTLKITLSPERALRTQLKGTILSKAYTLVQVAELSFFFVKNCYKALFALIVSQYAFASCFIHIVSAFLQGNVPAEFVCIAEVSGRNTV